MGASPLLGLGALSLWSVSPHSPMPFSLPFPLPLPPNIVTFLKNFPLENPSRAAGGEKIGRLSSSTVVAGLRRTLLSAHRRKQTPPRHPPNLRTIFQQSATLLAKQDHHCPRHVFPLSPRLLQVWQCWPLCRGLLLC
ncbi:hypothetical protein EV126DRAFT_50199 [Verticillium dahliae]|nr:hypothetical protein EV126DRAFT_50199 [Verticillium dahliae]